MGVHSGKVAVVTGSTDGIGLSIAERLCKEGARVVLSSRNEANVQQALANLRKQSFTVEGIVCHVGSQEHRRKLIEFAVEKFGRLDIFVGNAGVSPQQTNEEFLALDQKSDSLWDKCMEVNVKANYDFAKLAIAQMAKTGGGSIVFVSSWAPFANVGVFAYTVSKAALNALTKALAVTAVPSKVRVNCIAPGLIQTKMSAPLLSSESRVRGILSLTIQERGGQSTECSGVVSFLCSEDASFITGETYLVCGGHRARI